MHIRVITQTLILYVLSISALLLISALVLLISVIGVAHLLYRCCPSTVLVLPISTLVLPIYCIGVAHPLYWPISIRVACLCIDIAHLCIGIADLLYWCCLASSALVLLIPVLVLPICCIGVANL